MSDSNSTSDSSQTQIQESQDNRVTAATGSATLVASRSNVGGDVNISTTSTDFGTVSKAFDFAGRIATGAANESAASAAQVTKVTQSAMDSVKNAYAGVSDTLAQAYETSKAGEQKVMVAAGLALVAIVAFKSIGKSA